MGATTKVVDKERDFAIAYIENKFNGTEAVLSILPHLKKASATAEASKLLANVNVQTYLREELERIRSVQRFGLLELTEECRRLAFSNMADFLRINQDGDAIIDLESAIDDRVKMAAVQSVEVQEIPVYDDGEEIGTRKRVKLKLYDKNVALERLLRIFGAFEGKEPPQVNNHNTYVDARQQTIVVTAEDAAKKYRALLGRK
jgi:hypothetical protein